MKETVGSSPRPIDPNPARDHRTSRLPGYGHPMTANHSDSLFHLFKACYDAASQYPSDSPVVARHCRLLLEAVDYWLRRDGSLTITISAVKVTLNQKREIAPKQKDHPVLWFVTLCKTRLIFEMLFLRGLTVEELGDLIQLLQRETYVFVGQASAATLLAERGVLHIQLNPPSVEDSFTRQVPFSMGHQYYAEQDSEADFHLPEKKASPAQQAGRVESLYISQDDYETLNATMTLLITQGHMTRVADALTLMRNDLRSLDREDRELAFSSYQVVVKILVASNQTKALYRVVKAMPFDLRICQEYDLYRLHLDTFTCILNHFAAAEKYRPFLYGLTVLAEQSLRHRDPFKSLLENYLKSFLTPTLLESMVKKAETDADLRGRMHILFHEHALGIFNTLLGVLFDTKERRLRKVILETLHSMGNVIYPDVLNELDQALQENKPWYVKRNLLLLLSPRPPVTLVPKLIWLDQHETSKRVLSLVQKCIYRIEDRQAFELGYELLNRHQNNEGTLLELLRFVGEGGLAEYAPPLIDIAEGHRQASVRLVAIAMLGKIDSPVSLEYLKSIISKTSFFKKRSSSKRRVAAIHALSATPQHLTFLAKFIQDKDEKVRTACRQVLAAEE